jgi:transposase-like protein
MPKPMSVSETEVVANPRLEKRSRRKFTEADKRRIVAEAERCTGHGEKAALLRGENLYPSSLAKWQAAFAADGAQGLAPKKVGRKLIKDAKDREIEKLKKENARLLRRLEVKDDLLELQKKAISILDRLDNESTQ